MRKGARGENRPIKTLCALINTKKQSEHQAEQAELAHALIRQNNQSCYSGI